MTEIHHEPDQQRFTLVVDTQEAVLSYALLPNNTIDFTRTYVPSEFRGRGLAEELVRYGLRWARDQGFTIRASCWYVDKFLR